ncbi:aspartyl protease family protein [Tahibacter amnicola]|uniref:Aspartyl protease family protein n=1 Tax=Tahibacter amnicola TaxID=2976241 RepID=A0ABY6BFC0_9GAMM|nr:aspartyl protease family protein [Tahibacter amnicola]UXI68454.1 aspartyl protease family protein [Tahibacter amnicola]
MKRRKRWLASALFLCALAPSAQAATTDVFAECARAAGDWKAVRIVQSEGELRVGGLKGPLEGSEDVTTGQRITRYDLGVVKGAEGFDGTSAWSQDPGGEVTALDTPEARRRTATDSWISRRGYCGADAQGATIGPVRTATEEGRPFQVVDVTPVDANAITLWFDATSHLLARTVTRSGSDTVTTTYDDWRNVDGIQLPHRIVSDSGDVRNRSEILIARYRHSAAADATRFARPPMQRGTARVENGHTTVPFELVNNHIFVTARVDGKPLHVLVDTGGANILVPQAVQRLALKSEGQLVARGVGEKAVDLGMTRAQSLTLAGLTFEQPSFYVIDLDVLPQVEGVPVDGILGYEVFRRFIVRIDYAARTLHLYDPSSFTPPAKATAMSFALTERIPLIDATIDGLPARVSIDTGSRSSLSLHSPFVREHGLVEKLRGGPESVAGWGVGGPSRARPARLPSLKMGDVTLRNLAVDLFTGDKGAFANPEISANLGGGVLRRFTVTLDYENRRIYLEPNSEFGEADSFDRSGLWLHSDGAALKIVEVAPHSAAEKAGLKAGQRLTAIDGMPVARRTLAQWRAHLRDTAAGQSVALQAEGQSSPVAVVLADRIPAPAQ